MTDDNDSPLDDLTVKQRRFVEEYLANGGNGVQAALKVYDTDNYHTACQIASENVRKPDIKSAIKARMEAEAMQASEVLWRIAEEAKGEQANNRLRALDLLAKHYGLLVDRVEYSGESRVMLQGVDLSKLSDSALAELEAAIIDDEED